MRQENFVVQSLRKIHRGEYLSGEECRDTLSTVLTIDNPVTRSALWNAFFSALMVKKCDKPQILGLVEAVIQCEPKFKAKKISLGNDPVYDLRGSGKEDIKTFNVSTAAALVAASIGLKIIKNGSSSTSAVSGAIDILIKAGVKPATSHDDVKRQLSQTGFSLVNIADSYSKYASLYDGSFYYFHPLSYILPALASPYKIDGLIYGIADPNTNLSAELIINFGIPKAVAVCGSSYFEDGFIDEVSVLGKTRLSWPMNEKIQTFFLEPKDFGVELGSTADIVQRASISDNLDFFLMTLAGKSNRSAIDMVCVNAAVLLKLASRADTWQQGYKIAHNQIMSGKPLDLLRQLISVGSGDTSAIDRIITS